MVLDVAIAADGVLARVAAGINRQPRRAFGVLKTENEYVGVVRGTQFEIWERRQRAVHAVGEVRPGNAGTRIELRFVISARTSILLIVFFALYFVAAIGLAAQPPQTELSAQELVISVVGAGVLISVFAVAAWRQRADLRSFVRDLFRDVPVG
jgi:hypothetical protein